MKKQWILIAVLGLVALQPVAHAETVSGTVESVDTANNKLKLRNTAGEVITIVWKDNTPNMQTLENAQPGSQVTVDAN